MGPSDLGCVQSPQDQNCQDLLKARRIKVAYVPAMYTSVFSPPDQFIEKEIKAGNNKQFSHWYAPQINDQIDSGIPEDEVWVDFTLTNMKPIHARWTIATFEKLRDRKDLMRKAWEVTGLWSVIHGTFTPTPNCPVVYEDPGEENDEPPYDSESEYTSASEGDEVEGAGSDSDTQSDNAVPQVMADIQEEEAEVQVSAARRRRNKRVVLESSDEDSTDGSKKPPAKRATQTSERARLEEERVRREEEEM